MFHHFSLKKSAASFAAPVRFILIRSLLEAQKLASIMLELQGSVGYGEIPDSGCCESGQASHFLIYRK